MAGGPRSWAPRTLSATSAAAGTSVGDAASECGSCASLDSVDRQPAPRTPAAVVPDAEMSSAVDSDAAAASELRRRRRAELVRARTVGGTSVSTSEKPGDVVNEPQTTAERLSYPAASTSTDSVAFRRSAISTSSTPSLHAPVISSSSSRVDGEFPVVTQQPTKQQSFQQTHSKTPWRSSRTIGDTAPDSIPSRTLDHASRRAITVDQPQQIVPTTGLPTASVQSSSSTVTSSRTSEEGVRNEFRKPETRLKTSVYGSAPSVAASATSKTEPAPTGGDVATSASAAASRAKPRLTIYSSDNQGSSGAVHESAQTKDRFNELVGKALESTSPAGGGNRLQSHHELSTESPLHRKSLEVADQNANGNTAGSAQKKEEIEVEHSTPLVLDSSTTEPYLRQSRQPVSWRFNKEPTAVSSVTTDALESGQPNKAAVEKVPHRISRITGGGQQQPSKQYISDSSAFVSVSTQNTPVTSSGGMISHRSLAGSSQQLEENELGKLSTSPRTEFTMPISQSFPEGRMDHIPRLDARNATYVERSQHLNHSKLNTSASSSYAQSQKVQPLIHGGGESSEAVETRGESLLQEHQNILSMDNEANTSKVPDLQHLVAPPVPEFPQNKSLQLDAGTEKTSLHLNTAKFTHPTDANGYQHSRLENVGIPSESAGTSGKLEKSISSELATDQKKELSHDAKQRKQFTENRTDKTHSKGKHSRKSNVVEETQIVQILTFGAGESKPSSSASPAVKAPSVEASDKLTVSHESDMASPKRDPQRNEMSNVYQANEITSKLFVEELSKLDQTSASTSSQEMAPNMLEPYKSDTTNQPVKLKDQLSSEVPYSYIASEPDVLSTDSLSIDFKPLPVVPLQTHQAPLTDVPPWPEQKVERIYKLERQTAVVQEVEIATEQILSGDGQLAIERVKPVNVESTLDTADCQLFLTRTGCHYHDNALTLAASAVPHDHTDANSEKIEHMDDFPSSERLKPQNVESAFHSTDARRLLIKAGCQYRANVTSLAASERGDAERIGYMQASAHLQQVRQVKPLNVKSTFQSVDASPHLRKTGCQYRTKLLTLYPTNKDVVVPADRFRKPGVDQSKETIGKIESLKPVSSTSSTVEHLARERAKVRPAPQILTSSFQRGHQFLCRKVKSIGESSAPALEQTAEQKMASSTSGRAECRSDIEPLSAFPAAVQQAEIGRSLNQIMHTTDSRQPILGSSSVTSSDTLSSGFQVRGPPGAFAKASGDMPAQPSVGSQRVSDSSTESMRGFSELEKTSTRPGGVDKRQSSQDKKSAVVIPPQNIIADKKQLAKSEISNGHVDFATAASLPQPVNSSLAVSSACQPSAPTDLSASSQDEKPVSLSNKQVGSMLPAAASDQAIAEQYRSKLPAPNAFSGEAVASAKPRDQTKKARHILKSREEFLSLQAPATMSSTDDSDAFQSDLGQTSAQLQPSSTTRRTDPAKKDMLGSSCDSRPAKAVKIAIREDDVAGEDEDEEGHQVAPADTAKAAFPPLVSGRKWDAVVRLSSSSSVDEPTWADGVDRRQVCPPRQTSAGARLAFSAGRAATTAVDIPLEKVKGSRPILQLAKSVDSEPLLPTINIDPQLAAVLRMRKQREEEQEREEAELRGEETENLHYAENRYDRITFISVLKINVANVDF